MPSPSSRNLSAARRLHGDAASATLLRSSNLAALLFGPVVPQAEAVLTWHLRAIERVRPGERASASCGVRLAECRAAGRR